MPIQSIQDSYAVLNKINEIWEKQLNVYLSVISNNKELEQLTAKAEVSQFRTLELFRKNQEVIASILNVPTKSDLAKLTSRENQTEEKLDSLEEQLFGLSEAVQSTNKDIESVIDVSKEIIKLTKQLKTELTRTKKQLSETKDLQTDIVAMKKELVQLNTFKDEIEALKTLIDKGEQKEPVVAGSSGQSK
ncbi:polyhydroxyalkanoate biosynthesis repressor PhaR [Bacillus sp. DNRA2]|uniref:polyhydroxyalkanoate biosynthesis repressor PhaR n=1 Tax=Bacillus sp. DNRA2 TaxID=2723053 RepID=UPI00145F18D9|nr:polyhydroxyalkanoate biosynthesis repressor PhaR [Bacillus sp. DNRA2]NMD69670.1 polyhydroxyalkanoate biosynthesis repressor PhaR [Bacillus sp. DNRA2]